MNYEKIALVTGGSRGIGRACAIKLASVGYSVVINYNLSRDRAEKTAKDIRKNGGLSELIKADVANLGKVKSMFKFIRQKYKRLDVLINNAGIAPIVPFTEIDENEWDKIIDTNLKGPFFCAQEAFKIMKEQKQGRIINLGSQAGFSGGYYSGAHYAISKGGIHTFTKRLAKEGAPYNILVNCISPGIIDTDTIRNYPKLIMKNLIKNIPLGKIGNPDDVANVAVFLVSEQADYLTGINIPVSGGLFMN